MTWSVKITVFFTGKCDIWQVMSSAACTCLPDMTVTPAVADATRLPTLHCYQQKQVVWVHLYFLRTSRDLGLGSHVKENQWECSLILHLGAWLNFLWSFSLLHNRGQCCGNGCGYCTGHSSHRSGIDLGKLTWDFTRDHTASRWYR